MSNTWSKEVFASNLKRYMESAGKNQKEMAAIVGVSAPTFNEWLKAKKYPRIDKIEKLAHYFGIKKSDLIEEKTAEQKEVEKKAGSIATAVLKMKTDPEFMSLVEKLMKLDSSQVRSVDQMLIALLK